MLRSIFDALSGRVRDGLGGDTRRLKRSSKVRTLCRVEGLEERSLLAMAGVDVLSSAFAPIPVTVHVGDTVEWIWDSSGESTTSVAGSLEQWNSGVQNAGFVFDHTFTHVGTFTYYSTTGGSDAGNGTAQGMVGQIIVLPPSPLMMVMVTPANFTLNPGSTEQFMAMGMYADNTVLDLSADVSWASTNPGAATVSTEPASAGLVSALAPGTADITASFDGMVGSTPMSVTAPPPPVSVATPQPLVSVAKVQTRLSAKHLVTQLTVAFSGPVNASEADDVATYRLALPGARGSFDARNSRVIKLKSAVYDAATGTVTLTPRKPFALAKPVQLRINGTLPSGLEDSLGRLIDGNQDGSPGGNAVTVLRRKQF